MMEALERWLNHVSDMDLEWGPLLFLRPPRHERMTSLRVAQLAALYGVLAGLGVNVFLRLTGEHGGAALSPVAFPLATTLGFFSLFRVTFAASWNRRAERLQRGARD